MNTMQSRGSGVPDMIGSLSEANILASQQYYDHETSGRQPERSLMSAVLLDAVECFQKYLLLHVGFHHLLAGDFRDLIARWISSILASSR